MYIQKKNQLEDATYPFAQQTIKKNKKMGSDVQINVIYMGRV